MHDVGEQGHRHRDSGGPESSEGSLQGEGDSDERHGTGQDSQVHRALVDQVIAAADDLEQRRCGDQQAGSHEQAKREAQREPDVDNHPDLLVLAGPVPPGDENLDRDRPAANHDGRHEIDRRGQRDRGQSFGGVPAEQCRIDDREHQLRQAGDHDRVGHPPERGRRGSRPGVGVSPAPHPPRDPVKAVPRDRFTQARREPDEVLPHPGQPAISGRCSSLASPVAAGENARSGLPVAGWVSWWARTPKILPMSSVVSTSTGAPPATIPPACMT